MPYYTYILYSEKAGHYYTGSCENLELRLAQHNAGKNKSSKAGIPWALKYSEVFETRVAAVKRESEIKKKKSRKYIEHLIRSAG